jgi:ComF family protein
MPNPWRLLCELLWPEPADKIAAPRAAQQFQGTHYIVPYQHPAVKNTIRNNKFHYHKQSAIELARLLDGVLDQFGSVTIIPVPSSAARVRQRGYQHLETILQHSRYTTNVNHDVLQKHTNTPSQSHVSKAIRLQQQRGTFRCNQRATQSLTRTIILLDDVVTTGATIAAARAALTPHLRPGTKLVCLAIAH